MKKAVNVILHDLEQVRENLLSLSDDIWLSIDHNEPEALEEGYQFKKTFNEKLITFDEVSQDISTLVLQFLNVNVETKAHIEEQGSDENERVIRELDKEEKHSLNEDFSYKRPYGYVLEGNAVKGLETWRRLYITLCKQLEKKQPGLFESLPELESFISRRGNKAFCRSPEECNVPLPVTATIYAEGNLSANQIRNNIKKLLIVFRIPESRLVIYLREDRNS